VTSPGSLAWSRGERASGPVPSADVEAFERCIGRGGVALFPADTVYGLACNPGSSGSVARMYALKKRAEDRPAAVMFFELERALAALPQLGPRTVAALRRILPGAITAVVPNPAGLYALAGGGGGLGIRVPRIEGPLAYARVAVLQTSANRSGEPDARRLEDVAPEIREGVDIVLDGGELSGVPSSVVDLTRYEETGEWELLRETAVTKEEIAEQLSGL
jgi:L-threonylcarbamoyladenylate synthase